MGGYFLLSGGNGRNNETINSIDFSMQGFENGVLGGEIRYRAKNIGTDTLKIRIDKAGAEDILIFNHAENSEYAYSGDSWLKYSLTQTSPYSGLPFEEWAQEGPGTHEFNYQNFTVRVTIHEVNPPLKDNLFSPPENATIQEP